jgi:hypothetical protein
MVSPRLLVDERDDFRLVDSLRVGRRPRSLEEIPSQLRPVWPARWQVRPIVCARTKCKVVFHLISASSARGAGRDQQVSPMRRCS